MNALQKNWSSHIKKVLICILVFLFCSSINAQTACNPTGTPAEIYSPNTTSTPTINLGIQYLCGPNTIVYDTAAGGNGCRYAYLNNNTVLWLKTGCPISQQFLLKAGATLNILPGTSSPIDIIFEPGATINNPSSVSTLTTMCTNITFPIVNCSVGISESENINSLISIYPNPSSNILHIESKELLEQSAQIEIINCLGQRVFKNNFKSEINVSPFPDGVYTLQIVFKNQIAQKRMLIVK